MKKNWLIGLILILVLVGAGYWYWRTVNYIGLNHFVDHGVDEATTVMLNERISAAEAAIKTAEDAGEDVDLNLYLSIAQDAYILGDLVKARRAIEAQLAGNSINYVAQKTYAQILEDMGQLPRAEKAYLKAIEYSSNMQEFYYDYITFLRDHYPERKDDVKFWLDKSVEMVGQTPWNMRELAHYYLEQKDCVQMIAHYKVAVRLEPENQGLAEEFATNRAACGAENTEEHK